MSDTDRYGRLLRYVYIGDTFVNAALVALGYAQVATYLPDVKYEDLFLQLQKEAQETGFGLWARQVSLLLEIDDTSTSDSRHSMLSFELFQLRMIMETLG